MSIMAKIKTLDNRCFCCDFMLLVFGVCKCVGLQVRPPYIYKISMLDGMKFIASVPSKTPPHQTCCQL